MLFRSLRFSISNPLAACRTGALAAFALVLWASAAGAVHHGDLLVTDLNTLSVIAVDPVSGSQGVLTSGGLLHRPTAIAVNAAGDIFITEGDRFGAGSRIVKVNAATGAQSSLASGGSLLDPHDVAIQADGTLAIADFSGPSGLGGIIRVHPVTGAQLALYHGGFTPFELAVEASGDIVAAQNNFFASVLFRVHPATGTGVAINSNVGEAAGVAVESTGNILVSDAGSFSDPDSHIFRVDPASGARSTLTTGPGLGFGALTLDPAGTIYVTAGNAILRVDPTTGAQQVVSSGGLFSSLGGIAIFQADGPTPNRSTSWGRIKAIYH